MFNPFSIITKPIDLVTKSSSHVCNFLFISFVVIPVCVYFGGPRFTMASLNCFSVVFWFAIPFLMIVFSFLTLSWLRFTSSLAFATAWVPVCLFSFLVWMPLIDGVEKNVDPFSKLVKTEPLDSCTDRCIYQIGFDAVGSMGSRSTKELQIAPGLKWIEVTDQEIYEVTTLKDLLSKLCDIQPNKVLVEKMHPEDL